MSCLPRVLAAPLLLLSAAAHAGGGCADVPDDAPVVDTAWLARHAADANLVLLHVGEADAYPKAHIRGARRVSLDDVSLSDHGDHGLHLEMPPADDLRARLQNLGISDDSCVVVYYAKDWVSPATRVVYTLDYAGLGAHGKLLDGGMPAWVKDGHPTSQDAAPDTQGTLAPLQLQQRVVDAGFVQAHLGQPGYAVIDGRASVFYDGTDTGDSMGRAHKTGHIAGARSVPYTSITTTDLHLKSRAELAALFDHAGVKPGDTIVGYCHIGQQGTAMLYAARLLGHPVLLYDGSFEDWSRRDLPVENPKAKKS